MLVNLIEIKTTEKEALKKILSKIPLLSKVTQFNKGINDIDLKYIEYKILKYKIGNYENEFLRKNYRIVLLNTYTGAIKFVDEMPTTVKKYIARDCVQKSKINEYIDCEIENKVVGFLRYGKNKKNYNDKYAEVYALYVDSKYKNRGIGRHLLKYSFNNLKNLSNHD